MKILSTKTLHQSKWSSFKEKKFINTENTEKNWEYIERKNHAEAAVIVPVDSRKSKIILIKQFRVPLENYIIEFPAGLIDPDETPEESAERELLEETGFTVERILSVSPGLCTSPGLTNELVYIIEAEVNSLKQQEQNTEDSEDIEVILADMDTIQSVLEKFVKTGYIIDAKVWTYVKNLK